MFGACILDRETKRNRHRCDLLVEVASQLAFHGAEMSSLGVLGLAAESALVLFSFSKHAQYGSAHALIMTMRPPNFVGRTQQLCLASLERRTPRCRETVSSRRCFHTSPRRLRSFQVLASRKLNTCPRTSMLSSSFAALADGDANLDVPPLPSMSEHVRGLMRLLAHSVVACTSTFPGSGTEPPAPRAMTMSSFTSLALSPTPVVSFNISTPSRTFDAVEASRRFNIHVLADDASGARVADWLARGNAGGLHVFEKLAEECQCQVAIQEQEGADDPPVLRGPGVLYVLRCRLLDQPSRGLVKVRDHVIVLGEVLDILEGERAKRSNRGDKFQDNGFGLLYADRTYRQLGSCIIAREEAAVHTHSKG
ncbi:flavin reductase like domain-containing protein [Lasiosphaeria miniovina]|uniref:Flavin reductase like domain-containing protein n=1 Tax=Lasiosphaeria miniovina TaxID=1954250 RepID=A0AA40E819_9PEZI|nr:flavin reductase like domain-containing protein [Lasiosphaeria miniovina]KAK0727431.1 flavin reductase like domain-containing protein [Lasiosphaeria miniovina]